MSTAPGQAAPLEMLSAVQQRELLWSDARHNVYASIVTSKVPGLRERLAQAEVDDWDGVWVMKSK